MAFTRIDFLLCFEIKVTLNVCRGLLPHLDFFGVTHIRLSIIQAPAVMRENRVFGKYGNGKKVKSQNVTFISRDDTLFRDIICSTVCRSILRRFPKVISIDLCIGISNLRVVARRALPLRC